MNEIFRTNIDIEASKIKIGYCDKLMFIGSCFTENIGFKLQDLKFQTDINPFGVIYNPASVYKSIDILLRKSKFSAKDIHYHNELYFSFYHHSRFSNRDKHKCLENINAGIEKSADFIRKSKFLFITFGTSWVYKEKSSNSIVSNCHKLPAKMFVRSLLTVDEIAGMYSELLERLQGENPELVTVFTVSPIRHWKDGAVENQISKSTLILAIAQLVKHFKHTMYFPSYELMMDDLRDYRFYAQDMIHPNETAIGYIQKKFFSCFFKENVFEIMKKIEKLRAAKNHRPVNPESAAYKSFLQAQVAQIERLKRDYPFLQLEEELRYFKEKV